MIARGQTELSFDPVRGYLASLLASLDVPVSSQMLVFSGTSLQARLVSANTPRAIYFTDDVYVAWLQGSDLLEIAALDANLGPVFYTLRQEDSDTPAFQRHTGFCLECHDTYGLSGGGVPRFVIGSGPTDARGRSATHGGWMLTTDQTPLSRRWGGWYVTGTHGDQVHAGNTVVRRAADPAPEVEVANGNRTDLTGLLDTDPYLTGHSDIAALLVIEHQIYVQNLLTRVNWEVRTLLDAQSEQPGRGARGGSRRRGRDRGRDRCHHRAAGAGDAVCERSPDHRSDRRHVRLPLRVRESGTLGRGRTLASAHGSYSAPLPVSDELPRLLGGLRRPCRRGEGAGVPSRVGSARRCGQRRAVRSPVGDGPKRDPGNPAGYAGGGLRAGSQRTEQARPASFSWPAVASSTTRHENMSSNSYLDDMLVELRSLVARHTLAAFCGHV